MSDRTFDHCAFCLWPPHAMLTVTTASLTISRHLCFFFDIQTALGDDKGEVTPVSFTFDFLVNHLGR